MLLEIMLGICLSLSEQGREESADTCFLHAVPYQTIYLCKVKHVTWNREAFLQLPIFGVKLIDESFCAIATWTAMLL